MEIQNRGFLYSSKKTPTIKEMTASINAKRNVLLQTLYDKIGLKPANFTKEDKVYCKASGDSVFIAAYTQFDLNNVNVGDFSYRATLNK